MRTALSLALVALPLLLLACPAASASPESTRTNPFLGRQMLVDGEAQVARQAALAEAAGDTRRLVLLRRIAERPQAHWVTGHDALATTRRLLARARVEGRLALVVLYALPERDCGQHSAGGEAGPAAYRRLVGRLAALVGGTRTVVVLEPDALSLTECLSPAQLRARLLLLRHATQRLVRAGAAVYIDAGNARWRTPAVVAGRLLAAGLRHARGVSLNVSSTGRTAGERAYGLALARAVRPGLGRPLRAVVDTSRNGAGPTRRWCNPPGRALGAAPRGLAGDRLLDALLWIKRPGESDGACAGGPAAGAFWVDYALGLASRGREGTPGGLSGP